MNAFAGSKEKKLNILVHADTYTVMGDWQIDKEGEPAGTIANLNGLPLTFNYLIDFEDTNNLIHPDDIAYVEQQVLKDLKGNKHISLHFRIITPKGEIRYLQGSGSLTQINNAPIAEWNEIASKQELQLKIFQHAEQVADIGTWTWNLHTDEFFCTNNMYCLFDLEPGAGNVGLAKFSALIHPEDLENVISLVASMKEAKKNVETKFRIVLPKGDVRYLRTKAEIFTTAKGIEFFIGTTQDVTREERAETRVSESEALAQKEREESEKRIRTHEALLREAEIIGGMGSYEVQLPSMEFFFSDNMYRLLGYKPGAFKPTVAFIESSSVPEDIKEFHNAVTHAIETKRDYHYTRRVLLPNGQIRFLTSNGKVVLDETGNPVKVMGIVRDVTQHHAYEVALREKEKEQEEANIKIGKSKERLEAAINVSPNALSVLKSIRNAKHEIVDFLFEWVSKSGELMTGKDVTGLRLTEQFPKVKESDIFAAFVNTVETAQPVDIDRYYAGEGINRWIHCKAVKLEDGLFVSAEDITERKQAEQELNDSRELLQSIFNVTPNGFAVLNAVRDKEGVIRDFNYKFVNPAAKKIHHGSVLPGGTSSIIIKGFKKGDLFEKLVHVIETGEPGVMEILHEENGIDHWFSTSIVKLDDGVVISFEDITEKKQAMQQMLRLKDEVAQQATDKYLTLFNAMDEGFCIIEIIFNEDKKPVDYQFIDVNPAFEKHTGLTNALGKTLRRLAPDVEPYWFDLYGKVANTGEKLRSEFYVKHSHKWVEVTAFRIGMHDTNRVAVFFNDITVRKHREENLHFLGEITEDLTRLSTADEIMQIVGAKIGGYFHVTSCNFIEVDDTQGKGIHVSHVWVREGVPSALGKFVTDDALPEEFKRVCRAGETMVVNDTRSDVKTSAQAYAEYKIGALVGVPFLRNKEWKFLITATDTAPRMWREDEIELFRELASRVYLRLERARAEEALRQSEQRLKKALSIETVGVNFFNLDGRIIDVNKAFERMMGFSREELLTAVHWNMEAKHYAAVNSYITQELTTLGETIPYEKEFIRKDGTRWWGLCAARRISDTSEGAECVEFIIDITESKKAERQLQKFNDLLEQQVAERTAALEESKELLASVLEASPSAINVYRSVRDEQGKIIDFEWILANEKAKPLGTESDLIGKRWSVVYPEVVHSPVFEKMIQVVEEDTIADVEQHYINKGIETWQRVIGVKLGDGVVVTSEDITERKQVEQRLKEEHRRLKDSQAIGHVGSFEWNASTDKIYWSDEMYAIYGLEPQAEEMTLGRIAEFIHPDDRQSVVDKTLYRRQVPGKENLIHRLILKDGAIRYINRHFESFADENGRVTHLSGTSQDITEIKEAEEEVQKNLQILKQAEEVAEIGSWEFDILRNEFYWSDGLYEIFALAKDTIVHPETYFDFVVNEDKPVVQRIINFMRNDQQPFTEVIRIKTNSKVKTLKVKGVVINDEKGIPEKLLGIAIDVTALTESERQLKQHKELLQSVFEATPVGITLLAGISDQYGIVSDFEIRLINKEAEEQTGLTNLMGKRYREVFQQLTSSEKFANLLDVANGGKRVKFEYMYTLGEKNAWLNMSLEKVNEGVLVVSEDITARKKIEEQMRHQSLLFTRVVESSPDIIQIVNLETLKISHVNKILFEELGYPIEIVKKVEEANAIREFIHPEDLHLYEEYSTKLHTASDDETVEVEVRLRAFDKSWQWFKTRGKIFERDRKGKAMKYVSFSQNTTHAKQVEEERKNHQMLVEMDKAKTSFFNNVSHEFRTPITLLLAPLEDVVRNGGSSLSKQEMDKLQMARRNALRLQKLVNTLLDFSRIEAGRVDAIFQPTDLVKFTTELASNFRSLIEQAGLKYVVKIEDPEEFIYVNREMYEKIVLNLLSNAFKFTFKGKIEVILRANKKHIQLKVRDTGVGISKDNLPKIFDRFGRIEGARSRTHEGSGIGLALVRELVMIHGGSIKVESEEGQGTTFIVIIPRGKSHLPAKKIFESAERVTNGSIATAYVEELAGWMPQQEIVFDNRNRSKALVREKLQKQTEERPVILLADDNKDMREYLRSLLIDEYEVILAENGKKAIEALRPEKLPDLVLSDVMMPEVDGYQLLTVIKSNPATQNIPVVLLSARSDEEAKIEGMRYGADDYLVKPFSAKEMLTRIDARIQISRMQRRTEAYLLEANKQLEQRVSERTKELEQSRQMLQDQKDLLQKTLDAIPQMILVSDAEGKIKLINDQWFRYTGLSHEHFEDFTIDQLEVIHPSQTKEIFPVLQKTIETGTPYHTEVLLKNKEGQYLWHMKVIVPVYDDKGTAIYWVGSFIDVHEQFTHEKKLKEYKDLLEAVFNSSLIGIQVLESVYNENHEIEDFEWRLYNRAIQKLSGRDDLKGKRIKSIFPGVVSSGLFDQYKQVITTGEPVQFQHHYNQDGFDNWYDMSAMKLEDSVVVTINDISENKASQIEMEKMNESLLHKNHELKMLNEELSTFAFVASHDLREPLRKIQIFSQVLLQREEQNLTESGKDFFRRMMSAVHRMNSLIDDILTYSRASSGPREMQKEDLNNILENVKSDLSEFIRERKAIIESDSLPPIKCNALQMGQLFQNLISNGIKFQPKDNIPHIKIGVKVIDGGKIKHPLASPNKKFLRIEVTDNGIGFDQEYEVKIFQMFQRLHGVAEYQGTGMGLAICKKIVENHKGFITSNSRPGEGATFCCFFPEELFVLKP